MTRIDKDILNRNLDRIYGDSRKVQEAQRDISGTTGSSLYDFLGQAAWGATSAVSFDTIDAYDTYLEATDPGAVTYEESIAGAAAGDWDQLSGAGKAGYIVGQGLGMLPGFLLGGGLVKAGVAGVSGVAKKGMSSAVGKYAIKKGANEFSEFAGKEGFEAGLKKAGVKLDDKLSRKLVEESYSSYDEMAKIFAGNKGVQRDIIENSISNKIKGSLTRELGLSDDITTPMAKELLEIVTRNNVRDAEKLLLIYGSRLANSKIMQGLTLGQAGEKTGLFLGAMAYDGAIGSVLGAARGIANNLVEENLDVSRNELTGQFEYNEMGSDLDFFSVKAGKNIIGSMLEEGFYFAPLGITKYFGRGGTTASHLPRAANLVKQSFAAGFTRIGTAGNGMTKKAVRRQLAAIDALSEGNIAHQTGLSKNTIEKWASKGPRWYMEKGADEGQMKEMLKDIRSTYLAKAPIEWSKEFGADMIASLPRMAVGVVAMNLPGFLMSGSKYGFSKEQAMSALGETAPEIAANVFMGMYFSRKPHSFHKATDSKAFNKFFNTGSLKEYMKPSDMAFGLGNYNYLGFKSHQLRKTIGGLNTFGKDGLQMAKVLQKYGDPSAMAGLGSASGKAMKKTLDNTPEFDNIGKEIQRIKDINDNAGGQGTDLELAFNAKIADMIANKDITNDEAFLLQEKFHIAKQVLNLYKANQLDGLDISFTKDQAIDFVGKLSGIEFGGQSLNRQNINLALDHWLDKRMIEASEQPIDIHRSFLDGIMGILNIKESDFQWNRETGEITMPNLKIEGNAKGLSTLRHILNTGESSNWLKLGEETTKTLDPEQNKKLDELIVKHEEMMMELTYGQNWKSETANYQDTNILTSDAWVLPYYHLLRQKQFVNAYEIITKGRDHSLDPTKARVFDEMLDRYILFKNVPEIDEKVLQNVDLADDIEVVRNLHSMAKFLRPSSVLSNKGQTIKAEELTAIANQARELTGDLFSNSENLALFKDYSLKKSLQNLGVDDIATGIDTKVAINEMANNPLINLGDRSGEVKLPSLQMITSRLDNLKNAGKISNEDYTRVKDFYSKLVDDVEKSNAPIKFDRLVEKNEGDFIASIQQAIGQGELAMSQYLKTDLQASLNKLTANESTLKNNIEAFRLGLANIDDEKKLKGQEELLGFLSNVSGGMTDLNRTMKQAIETGDVYTLRALQNVKGDIDSFISAIESKGYDKNSLDAYNSMLLNLHADIKSKRQKIALKDDEVFREVLKRINARTDIPSKDFVDKVVKISVTAFKAKYKFTDSDFDYIFDLDRKGKIDANSLQEFANSMFDPMINDPNLSAAQKTDLRKVKNDLIAQGDSQFDVSTPAGRDTYNQIILQPIKVKMKTEIELLKNDPDNTMSIPDANELEFDFHTITSNYFSKTDIKTLQIDLKSEKLYLDNKVQGFSKDRGFTGILNELDAAQNSIFIANSSGIDVDGNVIRSVSGNRLSDINSSIQTGKFEIVDIKDKANFLRGNQPSHMANLPGNITANLSKASYTLMNLNEGTSLIVRTDSGSDLYLRLKTTFRDKATGDTGGDMNLLFKAILGDSNGKLVKDSHRQLLKKMQEPKTPNDIITGIELIRVMKNNPGALDDVLAADGTVDLKKLKNYAKRDKMNEPKNGFIPTQDNLDKVRTIYENAESGLYKKVWSEVEDFYKPGRKLKVLSIDDEGKVVDANGNPVRNATDTADMVNIFDSITKAKVQIEKMVTDGLLKREEADAELESLAKVSKSIVDGDAYMSKKAYLAMLSMQGVHEDMVITNDRGDVVGFKSGGIKPTVTHANVDITNGRIDEFFLKTAFKYDPEIGAMLDKLGLDVLTFGSAAKINAKRDGFQMPMNDRNVRTKAIDLENAGDIALTEGKWLDFIVNDQNLYSNDSRSSNILTDNIAEVPMSALSLRTVSKEKRPMVGQNAGVHMDYRNGISDWIGLPEKLSNFNKIDELLHGNIDQASALARKVMGHSIESGDPAAINSPMSSVLENNGIIAEPFLRQELERNLIGYALNNGSIAGGKVEDGSFDVMSADFGNLKISVRGEVGDFQTVRYFGEFMPSYYAATSTKWKVASKNEGGIQNVIIQKIDYNAPDVGTRKADGFLVELDQQKVLQIEGMAITSDGTIIDIHTKRVISKASDANKAAYKKAVANEVSINKFKDSQGNSIVDGVSNLNEVGHIIKKWNESGNETIDAAVGMLNVRQPRNMIGDVVISRMAYNADVDGFHVDQMSGNVSKMNHADAIKPQDADFDFDKSFNYVAAPGLFWQQSNLNAGAISRTETTYRDALKTMFDPTNNESVVSQKIIQLLNKDNRVYSQRQLEQEVKMAMGQFVKMHQTSTYLVNMFKNDPGGLVKWQEGSTQYAVRIVDRAKQINTVDNINDMAIRFVDMYNKLPSQAEADINGIIRNQDRIWYGQSGIGGIMEAGLFEVGIIDRQDRFVVSDRRNLSSNDLKGARDAINNRIIRPLNKYLKLNQGMEADETGITRKAGLQTYHEAWKGLVSSAFNVFNKKGIDEKYDISGALNLAKEYMANSRNPFDMAMNSLSRQYVERKKKLNSIDLNDRQVSTLDAITNYLDYGGTDRTTLEGLKSLAIRNFVDAEGNVIAIKELSRKRAYINNQIEETQRFVRPGEPSTKLDALNRQKIEIDELIAYLDAAVSVVYEPDTQLYPPREMFPNRKKDFDTQKNTYTNNTNKPIVVRDKTGLKIKEVIMPGQSNTTYISKNDKLLQGARKYLSVDSREQEGLRILEDAFGGTPVIRNKENGVWTERKFFPAELELITKHYKRISAETIQQTQKMPKQTKPEQEQLRLTRESILLDGLFSGIAETDEAFRKALILRMLAPKTSDNTFSQVHVGNGRYKYDTVLQQNHLARDVMGILTKIASGQIAGDKDFAHTMLKDIENMKLISYVKEGAPEIEVQIYKSRLYTEDTDVPNNPMLNRMNVGEGVIARLQSEDQNLKNAALNLLEYADGSRGMIDPVTLYKTERALKMSGLQTDEVWGRTKYMTNEDGTLKKVGETMLRVSEVDRMRRKDLGELNGKEDSGMDKLKRLMKCYKN